MPHVFPRHTSTLPSFSELPPTNLTSPSEQFENTDATSDVNYKITTLIIPLVQLVHACAISIIIVSFVILHESYKKLTHLGTQLMNLHIVTPDKPHHEDIAKSTPHCPYS